MPELSKIKDRDTGVEYEVKDDQARKEIVALKENGNGNNSGGNADYVTPQMFGAKADGVTDDTKAINTAVNALANGGTIYFPPGKYIVNHGGTNYTTAIVVENKNNITFKLDNAATIKHSVTESGYYYPIEFKNCDRVEIFGGTIEGEADEHTNRTYEDDGTLTGVSSYCVHAVDCTNFHAHDLVLTNCYGDGIGVVGSSDAGQLENVLIENCHIYNHVRNGVVFSGIKNGIIRNCHIHDIDGCLPMAGIDLEAHYEARNENIVVEGCYIHDCTKYAVIHSSNTYDVTIRNCNLLGNTTVVDGSDGFKMYDTFVNGVAIRNNAIIKGCSVCNIAVYKDSSATEANLDVQDSEIRGRTTSPTVQFSNVTVKAAFKNCTLNHLEAAQYALFYPTGCSVSITLEDCDIHLWETEKDAFQYDNANFKTIDIFGCRVIVESETVSKRVLRLHAVDKLTFVNNTVDMRNVTSYGQSSIVALKGCTVGACCNNAFLSQVLDTPLCANVFGATYVSGNLYVLGNSAPTWDSIASSPNSTYGGTLFSRNNVVSGTTDENKYLTNDNLGSSIDTALAQAKASGVFDGAKGDKGEPGKDGANGKDGTSATHSWNGTVLTITSASGSSSADLKGEKGETGAKGDKGEKGDTGATGPAYTLTETDKTEMVNAVIASLPKYTGEVVEV